MNVIRSFIKRPKEPEIAIIAKSIKILNPCTIEINTEKVSYMGDMSNCNNHHLIKVNIINCHSDNVVTILANRISMHTDSQYIGLFNHVKSRIIKVNLIKSITQHDLNLLTSLFTCNIDTFNYSWEQENLYLTR